MSNKEKMKKVFNVEFSKDKNYQSIMEKIGKKNKKHKYYINWSLAPMLTAILLIICLPFILNEDKGIYVNNLQEDILPRATFRNLYQSVEYDVKAKYPFVVNIKIPGDLNKLEEGITFTGEEDINIHDYIVVHYSDESSRSIKISFTKKDVESFTTRNIDAAAMKESRIYNIKVIIVAFEDNYYAKLEHKDLIFNIETNKIELNELVNMIKSILK